MRIFTGTDKRAGAKTAGNKKEKKTQKRGSKKCPLVSKAKYWQQKEEAKMKFFHVR